MRTLTQQGKTSQFERRRRAVIRAAKAILLERLNVWSGSQPEVSNGHKNVGYRGYSGSRFRATGGLLVARFGHSRLAINQRKCGIGRVIVPGFRIHWHLSDLQVFDQSAGLHISENRFKARLLEIRFLDTDHK